MNGSGPRLYYLEFVVSDSTCILRTCDLLAAAGHGHAIERGQGRHGISSAFFLYVRDPEGNASNFIPATISPAIPILSRFAGVSAIHAARRFGGMWAAKLV